jgi:hypothetical protein
VRGSYLVAQILPVKRQSKKLEQIKCCGVNRLARPSSMHFLAID